MPPLRHAAVCLVLCSLCAGGFGFVVASAELGETGGTALTVGVSGGPEEGGWWYTEYELEGSKAFTDEEEAVNYRDWLRDKIEKEQSLGHRYNRPIHSAEGFENLPDDQIPLGFAGSARDYVVRIEDSPGEMARRPAPHYE